MRKRISILILTCAVFAGILPTGRFFPAAWFFSAPRPACAADQRQVGVVPSTLRIPDADKNWLVAVGINHYTEERVNALLFCKSDAEAIYAFFTKAGAVPESSAYLLVSGHPDPKFHPTRVNILESIQYAAQKAGPDSTILLFFAGHGFVDTDGNSYLLPQDGKISLLRDTAISINRVNEILRESACKRKVVFMDACRNAPVRDGRGAVEEKRTQMFLEALKASAGQVTLAACGEGQTSLEDTDTGHGVFTLHVLRGLAGAAQADRNGLINVTTLQQYLAEAVPAWGSKRRKPAQNPWMWGEISAPIPLAVAGHGPILVPLVDGGGSPIVTPTAVATAKVTPTVTPLAPRPRRSDGLQNLLLPTAALVVLGAAAGFLLLRRKRKAAAGAKKSAGSETAVLSPATAKTPEASLPCGETGPVFSYKEGQATAAAVSPTSAVRFPGEPLPEEMERARLVFEGAESPRKILLLVQPRLAVGVTKFTKDPRVDLTLRFLPCRSEEQDPENWRRNRLISSPHCTIEARDDHFAIRDEIHSKNGTSVIELRGGEDDTSQSVGDTDTVFETPSMMEEIARVPIVRGSAEEGKAVLLPKGRWVPLEERCGISIGRRAMVLHAQTFSSKKQGLYALRLKRTDNCPTLEYVQLIRRAYIGSDPKCPIRVFDSSFPRLAAAIDFKKGTFFLATGQSETRVLLNREEVGKNRLVPLTRASLIEIGAYRWRFEPASVDDFAESC